MPIIIVDLILIIINSLMPFWDELTTTMTFDGKLTYDEGNLTFIILNGNERDSKKLVIYTLTNEKPMDIPASNLTNNTTSDNTINIFASQITDEKTTTHSNILFNDNRIASIEANDTIQPSILRVKLPTNITAGSYEGWIFAKSSDISQSIPIRVETGPKVYVALVWVVIGILTSIIFWEIIKYFAISKSDEEDDKRLHDYMASKLTKERISHATIINIGTVGFGIGVGFLALLSQGFVMSIQTINTFNILALFGLGLGIGSLREFVTRASESNS